MRKLNKINFIIAFCLLISLFLGGCVKQENNEKPEGGFASQQMEAESELQQIEDESVIQRMEGGSAIKQTEEGVALQQIESEFALQQEVIYMLIYEDIDKAVCEFYETYLTLPPTTDLYSYEFLSIDKTDNFVYQAVVEVEPFVGAHDPVGTDRITVLISFNQENQVISFDHAASYEIPEHLKSLIKQPLPKTA